MPKLDTPKDIQVFNGMAQFYHCFIHNFAFIMALHYNKMWVQSISPH